MKYIYLGIILFVATASIAFSQDTIPEEESSKFNIDIGADIVSSYIWRGLQSDPSPNIQGWSEFGISGFSFGVWASANYTGTFTETDFYVSYSLSNFTASITDYFVGWDNYFTIDKDSTLHADEIGLMYTVSKDFPLQISLASIIYGADKKVNNSTKNNYSTYIELMYPLSQGNTDINLILGGVTHESSFYMTDGAAIINVGVSVSKEIKVTDHYSLPISFSVTANPELESIYTVFKITF